eukprot:89235_1
MVILFIVIVVQKHKSQVSSVFLLLCFCVTLFYMQRMGLLSLVEMIVVLVVALVVPMIVKIIKLKYVSYINRSKKRKKKLSQLLMIDEIIHEAKAIKERLLDETDKIKIRECSSHLNAILETMKELNNDEKYIDNIRVGINADRLLIAAFVHPIAKHISMQTNIDVENLCVRFYSLNEHNSPKAEYLCNIMKDKLPMSVVDVVVDDVRKREHEIPLRIIDHRLTNSLLRTQSKFTVAINPKNTIIKKMMDTLGTCGNDQIITDVIQLIYETQKTRIDSPLEDPASLSTKVNKLLKLGLEIDSESEQVYSDDSSECESEQMDERQYCEFHGNTGFRQVHATDGIRVLNDLLCRE